MDDALAKEEARQLELALAASLADQGTPPPQQTPQSSFWGNVSGTPPLTPPPQQTPQSSSWGNVSANPPLTQPSGSTNRTPPNTTPKASGSIGGPGGLAYIPGFGNVLDSGPRSSYKPSPNPSANPSPKPSPKPLPNTESGVVGINGLGLGLTENGSNVLGNSSGVGGSEAGVRVSETGFANEGLQLRQRRAGVNGGLAASPLGGPVSNGSTNGLLSSQDELDRELALKLAAEENRPGPHKSDEERDRLLALRLQDEEDRSARNSAHPSPQKPAFPLPIYPPTSAQSSPLSKPPVSATTPSKNTPQTSPSDEQLARDLQQQLALEDRQAAAGAAGANGVAPRGGFRLPLGGTLGSAPRIPAPLRSLGQRLRDLGADSPNQTCAQCKQALSGQYLQTSDHAKRYHPECYQRYIVPRCSVCKMSIPADEHGVIQYLKQSFWGDKRCPVHDTDGTAQCSACHRMEPVDVPYVTLDDGRKLCLDCCSSCIVDTADCQPLYREVLEFYETMGMRLPQKDIPLLLVERGALNEAQKKETSEGGKPGVHDAMTTRGLCLSEEQEIRSVVRKPVGRAHSDQGLSHATEQKVVRRHCEVTAILILFGLPRVLTGSILAHELMHAWLRLDGSFPSLDPVIEEGICQVLAHMWLQTQLPARRPTAAADGAAAESHASESEKVGQSDEQVKEKLAEFFLHEIEMNPTAVYGAGFRAGHAAMVKFGLETVLEHMRMTGVFPA